MLLASNYWVHNMHSLETGVVVSIAAFFFFSFLTFTFLRESNISKEILINASDEKSHYEIGGEKNYSPEVISNIVNIFVEEEKTINGEGSE